MDNGSFSASIEQNLKEKAFPETTALIHTFLEEMNSQNWRLAELHRAELTITNWHKKNDDDADMMMAELNATDWDRGEWIGTDPDVRCH